MVVAIKLCCCPSCSSYSHTRATVFCPDSRTSSALIQIQIATSRVSLSLPLSHRAWLTADQGVSWRIVYFVAHFSWFSSKTRYWQSKHLLYDKTIFCHQIDCLLQPVFMPLDLLLGHLSEATHPGNQHYAFLGSPSCYLIDACASSSGHLEWITPYLTFYRGWPSPWNTTVTQG